MRILLFATLLIALSVPLLADDSVFVVGTDRTLVNPACSHCKDEAKRRKDELRPDDRVLCWIRGKYDGGAIPYRFYLNAYPVISDTYGVFVRDPDAGFARGFAPSLDFTFHGWRKGVMVMRHKDGTLFSTLTGVAFEGKRKGERLDPVPTVLSDWGWWVDKYPDTVAYHMFAKYKPMDEPKASSESKKTRGKVDARVGEEDRVLGVRVDNQTRAYPLGSLRDTTLIHDTLGKQPLVVLFDKSTKAAAAYAPTAEPPKAGSEPRTLRLRLDKAGQTKDVETDSTWDIAGRCVAGPLRGWTLKWLDGVEVKWYAWAAEYPETTIYKK